MIEIVSEKQKELENQKKKEEERKIVFDKTMKNGPFEILYKPVKLNKNEIKKLGLKNGNLNLVTLSYVKEDGTRDEFVLGNLTNIEVKDGRNNISKDMKKFNSDLGKNYKVINPKARKDDLEGNLNYIKKRLEEYNIEYTPESYEFFNNSQESGVKQDTFVSKKSVSIVTNSDNFDNLEIYDDIKIETPFNPEKYYKTHERVEKTLVDDLREFTNSDEEIVAGIKKVEEFKDYEEIAKYLDQLDTNEKVVKFFEDNPGILEKVVATKPEYKKVFENRREGKTNIDDKGFAKIVFTAVIEETKKDPKLMEMVVMPEQEEAVVEQER